jgi:hypothetical protein
MRRLRKRCLQGAETVSISVILVVLLSFSLLAGYAIELRLIGEEVDEGF